MRCSPNRVLTMSDDADFRIQSQQLRLVASARGESEYDVFVAAWSAWHGTRPPPGQVDQDFGAYLREQGVPPYVRHFVRQWLEANPDLPRRFAEDFRATRRAQLLALALIILAVVIALIVRRWT